MHPAYSVIFFTVASGAGYGLLFLCGLLLPPGLLPQDPALALIVGGLAFLFVAAGLISSTGHLGHKLRAWRAFSQWRSSWLSREAVLAVITFPPAIVFVYGWFIGSFAWWRVTAAGILMALLAAGTVFATAMIYRSLKPIFQWYNSYILPCYFSFAFSSGSALLLASYATTQGFAPIWLVLLALLAISLSAVVKLFYWHFIDEARSKSDLGTATGLGHLGKVRPFDPPHTGTNYLLQEMGYQVARKHSMKLRRVAFWFFFILPLTASLLLFVLPVGIATITMAWLSSVILLIGLLMERWLFFAEAKHTVTLYYKGE